MKSHLTKNKIKELQKKASLLKPIIMIGHKGLTESVISEIDIALNTHELIKVRNRGADKDECAALRSKIEQQLQAQVIRKIGFITVFYRQSNH